jgi:hypothetical protein
VSGPLSARGPYDGHLCRFITGSANCLHANRAWSEHTVDMSCSVRTVCALCGTVDVPLAAARLSLTVRGEDLRNALWFTCPKCGLNVSQPVDERGTRLLSAAGITVVTQSHAPVDTGRGTSA